MEQSIQAQRRMVQCLGAAAYAVMQSCSLVWWLQQALVGRFELYMPHASTDGRNQLLKALHATGAGGRRPELT